MKEESTGIFRILGLRFNGSFDLPKGGIEPYESALDAALRETKEEAGITELDFRWGLQKKRIGNLILYMATTTQEPTIRPNPATGELEHDLATWLTLDEAEQRLHADLRPAAAWVRSMTRGS